MKKIIIFIMLVSSVFFVSCESVTYDQIAIPSANPTYAVNVEPVIKANCAGCHSGGSQYPNLGNYAEVKDATLNGNLICRIDQSQSQSCGGVMPQSGSMSKGIIDMIILWQQQGCVN